MQLVDMAILRKDEPLKRWDECWKNLHVLFIVNLSIAARSDQLQSDDLSKGSSTDSRFIND